MRVTKTFKNSIYAIVSYCLLAILPLLVRRAFLQSLPVELLGYEGLFGNIFGLLALADLGIETIILYRLFPAFANNNNQEIDGIMSIYRWLYRIVGGVVLIVGISLIPFLKFIIKDNNLDWTYVYIIYIIQLIITLCTYFLAYKRLLFMVSQQEYVCTKVDTIVSLVSNVVKIIVLLWLQNYFIYLICNLCSNLLGNIIISHKVKSEFPDISFKKTAGFKKLKESGISKDVANNLVQKICGTIYGGTDSIVASAMLGISSVGLLSNYLLIQGYVTGFLTKVLKPFQMSIGDYIYSKEKDEGYWLFRMFDLMGFNIASVVATCYLCLFNPFITLWLGEKYQLDMLFVAMFAFNQYIAWNHQFLTYYRYSFGKYELDKYPMLFAAIINIVLSIVLCRYIGLAGIMIGTIIGHLGIWIGRVRVVYSQYIGEPVKDYAIRQGTRLGICVLETTIVFFLCRSIPVTWGGLALRCLLSLSIPVLTNYVLFHRTREMKDAISYIRLLAKEIKNRTALK